MAYVYHQEDGTILAVSPNNILSFGATVMVTFYSDLPMNVDYSFYKITDLGIFSENIQAMKSYKMSEISTAFYSELSKATFVSPTLGFRVDNRRSNGRNDKDNISSIIKLGYPVIPFKSADNSIHEVTRDQLIQLELEMIRHGFSLYETKWSLEAKIQAGTTNAEIQAIKWEI